MRDSNNVNGKKRQELNDLKLKERSLKMNFRNLQEFIPILESMLANSEVQPEKRAIIEKTLASRIKGLEEVKRDLLDCEKEIKSRENQLKNDDMEKKQGFNP
jgi:hypothetical protein